MDEYGLWALPFVIILAFIVWVYEVGWKQRDERKLIKFLKEEAVAVGDKPDEILRKLVTEYANKKRHEQAGRR